MGGLHRALRDLGASAERLRTDAVTVHRASDGRRAARYESSQTLTVLVFTDEEVEAVLRTAVDVAGDVLLMHRLEQALADPDALCPTASGCTPTALTAAPTARSRPG